ncbi:MAG: M4 family metallopeptidase [Nocardioides sp.]
MSHQGFIPPYLLEAASSRERLRSGHDACARTLALDAVLRGQRLAGSTLTAGTGTADTGTADAGSWTVSTANNTTSLPGTPVRTQADPPSGDTAVDQAWEAVKASLAGLADHLGRDSFDNAGAPVLATVHYSRDYANAFWNGTYLVFGDGDGTVFGPMTAPIDVGAHELGHAVTEHVANLTYQGQSGALNESMSDVFGACVKQDHLGQSADQADWLIGEGIFVPGINGVALRSMIAPGTAYDDPRLGQDPQPDHMSGYVVTSDDNGGVHYNSGIPNRAFALAATSIGAQSWTTATIWFAALETVEPDCTFATFARATLAVAGAHAAAVEDAWATVGVLDAAASRSEAGTAPKTRAVTVRRSGGLLGQVASGALDLDSGDPRVPQVQALLGGIDTVIHAVAAAASRPVPDGYRYTFDLGGDRSVTVAEDDMVGPLREIARLVLPEHGRPPALDA